MSAEKLLRGKWCNPSALNVSAIVAPFSHRLVSLEKACNFGALLSFGPIFYEKQKNDLLHAFLFIRKLGFDLHVFL